MKSSIGPVVLTLAAMFGIYLVWGDGRPTSETFRYKLTINVRVDGTPYSASSVIEATQEKNSCPWWGFSGSGASGGCLPLFSAKGVAPMIMLPDGAVIFASLGGYQSNQPLGVGGVDLGRMPWLIYVPDWYSAADTSGVNWSLIPLPKETPRLKIPFAGHRLSKFKPVVWWIPAQQLGPPKGYRVGLRPKDAGFAKSIELIEYTIETTSDELVEWLEPAPAWMAAYRGGLRISEQERQDRIREIVRENDRHDAPARSNLETSKRTL